MHSAEAIRKQEFSESLPRASIQDVGTILMGAGYEVIMPYLTICFIFFFISLRVIGSLGHSYRK
jgi:hypothetical protein